MAARPLPASARRAALTAMLLAALWVPARAAALRWENPIVTLDAVSGDPAVVAQFRYENPGPGAVRLQSIHSDCDCVTTEASHAPVPAGTAGFVRVSVDLRDRFGRLQKELTVTDDSGGAPAKLTVRVNIAELVHCTPRLVRWALGSPGVEQAIEVESDAAQALTALDPPASTEGFAARLQMVEPGRKYVLRLTPASTGQPIARPIHLTAHLAGRPPVSLLVYAIVR